MYEIGTMLVRETSPWHILDFTAARSSKSATIHTYCNIEIEVPNEDTHYFEVQEIGSFPTAPTRLLCMDCLKAQ